MRRWSKQRRKPRRFHRCRSWTTFRIQTTAKIVRGARALLPERTRRRTPCMWRPRQSSPSTGNALAAALVHQTDQATLQRNLVENICGRQVRIIGPGVAKSINGVLRYWRVGSGIVVPLVKDERLTISTSFDSHQPQCEKVSGDIRDRSVAPVRTYIASNSTLQVALSLCTGRATASKSGGK